MPLLGRQTREILPPIKNPAFSLTEKNAVTITDAEQDEGSSNSQASDEYQKPSRFSGFGNPFKRRSSSHSLAQPSSSQNNHHPPRSASKLKSKDAAESSLKPISVENAQKRLVAESRRSPRQKSPISLDFEQEISKGTQHKSANSTDAEPGKGKQTQQLDLPNQTPAVSTSPTSPRTSTRIKSVEALREIIMDGIARENFEEVEKYFSATFESFVAINQTFKVINKKRKGDEVLYPLSFLTGDALSLHPNYKQGTNILEDSKDIYDPRIDFEYYDYVCDSIINVPKDVQKFALRSMINCLLKDSKRNGSLDDARALIILLMNPLFSEVSTYTIFAHLLRQISTTTDKEQLHLINWFRRIHTDAYKKMVSRIQKFICQRLFPTNVKEMPPVEKCRWWIQTAVKVLALLNSACWMIHPPLHSHKLFYCAVLDNIDLMREYDTWQRQTGQFSFCQYPFLLSLASKRFIMQKDSEMKMLNEARESIVKHVKRKQVPNMGMLFFNLKVRRSHLISDSLNEIANKKKDLKKKLRVTFTGEPGLDLGGLTKEWFLLLIRRIFREEYGMFTYNSKVRNWWFNSASTDTDHEFNLLGVLMGLAVYNSINLDIRLPLCCYKKLLSPAVVPFHNPNAPVGIGQLGLNDLNDVNPELGNGLKQLLEYDGDVENDLCQTFQVSYTSFGQLVTKDLKRNGSEIPVTNENREEYVKLYVNYLLNKSIYKQFYAFYHGFHSVCASNALILLRPEEVEMLVCGNPDFDITALQQVTVYDGYTKNDPAIRRFWEVVLGFSLSLKKKMLLFTTGSDRVPVGGMSEMHFKITRMNGSNVDKMLPMAHTCFNQLILPPYRSKKLLNKKLTIAISNSEGFGIE